MARELASSLDRARLASFRDHFSGEVVLSDDPGYDGDTKYERLRALKRTWDADNVFRMNQNIQP